ncbi:Rid family hydrolase [Mycobacterium sp. TKK-01-0059]|uniref:Rid family hydrolase n=1 Tax=Mycobacterium sp. TKK-01-0059 TaxID=1324269 RepID=UPI001C54DB42|nr:Rid family hydrolase [Mycobacterium sp. TKK-01-0059]
MSPADVFSHAVIAENTVAVSGRIGIDPSGLLLGGCHTRLTQSCETVQVPPRAAGAKLTVVVKSEVVAPHDASACAKLGHKFLPPRPASSLYALKAFAMSGLPVELDVTAIGSPYV